MRNVRISGMGAYVPSRFITPEELAKKIGVSKEVLITKVGMKSRYYASKEETSSYMGAQAAKQALEEANLTIEDIDLIVCANGTMQMPIPCTAALIHHELGFTKPIPAYDINSTCLSFITALDITSQLIETNQYKHILIVSTEVASPGLNYNDLESSALFGDGAAAAIISKSLPGESSGIVSTHMQTFSEGRSHCTIPGGGSAYHPENWKPETADMFQFRMNGKEVFRMALKYLPNFFTELLTSANCTLQDIDCVVPHQASLSAMNIFERRLGIAHSKLVNIIEDYGNMIAASVPTALHFAIQKKQIKRGDRVLLIGTSAGFSIGGIILDY